MCILQRGSNYSITLTPAINAFLEHILVYILLKNPFKKNQENGYFRSNCSNIICIHSKSITQTGRLYENSEYG